MSNPVDIPYSEYKFMRDEYVSMSLANSELPYEFRSLDLNTAMLLTTMSITDSEEILETLMEESPDVYNAVEMNKTVLMSKLSKIGLVDVVEDPTKLGIFLTLLGSDRPGTAVIVAIDIVDHIAAHGENLIPKDKADNELTEIRKRSVSKYVRELMKRGLVFRPDTILDVYGGGFYTIDTAKSIVDNVLKTNSCTLAFLY